MLDSAESLPPSWGTVGIRSILILPLLQGDVLRGLFCVINKTTGLFNQDDVRLLALLTGRVTDVLHRIGLDQDLSTRHASEVGLLRREDLNLKEYRVTIHR